MSLRQDAARGGLWAAVGNWGFQLSTLVIFVLLSRHLDAEDFGLVALAIVFTGLVKILGEQGLVDAIVQRPDLDDVHLDTAFWASVGLGGIFAAALAAASGFIAELLNEPDLGPVLATLSIVLFISTFSAVQRAILQRKLAISSLTLRRLSAVTVGGIAGVVAAIAGLGVWSLVIQSLVAEVVGAIALWTVSDWRPGLHFSRSRFNQLLGFGISVVGFRILRFVRLRSDNLLIGAFLGAAALGFYSVAYRLLRLVINMTTSVVGMVAFPVFSRIQTEPERIKSAYYKAIGLTTLIVLPAFVGLAALAPEVTRLVFGDKWSESVPVMRVLALAGMLESVNFVNGVVMKSLGKPSWRLAIVTVEAAVSIVAFAIALQWGIVAVAGAVVVVGYLMAPVSFAATNKLIGLELRRWIESVVIPLGASIAMLLMIFGLKPLVADMVLGAQVALLAAIGGIGYIGSLWIFGRTVAKEAIEMARLAIRRR